jgi:hypothetical protein
VTLLDRLSAYHLMCRSAYDLRRDRSRRAAPVLVEAAAQLTTGPAVAGGFTLTRTLFTRWVGRLFLKVIVFQDDSKDSLIKTRPNFFVSVVR